MMKKKKKQQYVLLIIVDTHDRGYVYEGKWRVNRF